MHFWVLLFPWFNQICKKMQVLSTEFLHHPETSGFWEFRLFISNHLSKVHESRRAFQLLLILEQQSQVMCRKGAYFRIFYTPLKSWARGFPKSISVWLSNYFSKLVVWVLGGLHHGLLVSYKLLMKEFQNIILHKN